MARHWVGYGLGSAADRVRGGPRHDGKDVNEVKAAT